jgi:cell division protein FtsB
MSVRRGSDARSAAPARPGAGRSGSAPQGRSPGRPARSAATAATAATNPAADPTQDAAVNTLPTSPGVDRSAGEPRPGNRTGAGGVRRNRLTGRATALFVVLAMLAVAYAWPVKEYLRQRSELAVLRADTVATQARVDALTAEQKRWADPAYVKAQARDRLHYVMPGETAYVVLQPDRPARPQTLPAATQPVPVAWYDALWGTVQGADRPPTH